MWLKGVLVGQGHKVWLPQLPNADKPDAATYTDFLLANNNFIFNEETILIGHSSGAVAILNLLQNLPGDAQIKASVLVSAFKDDLDWDDLSGLFIEPFDFDKIKTRCSQFVFIHSDNDPYVPLDQAEYLTLKTGGELLVAEGQGHFNTELGPQYKRFPELLDILKPLL
jgi:predicted alpha/beta hydrolase family esterase